MRNTIGDLGYYGMQLISRVESRRVANKNSLATLMTVTCTLANKIIIAISWLAKSSLKTFLIILRRLPHTKPMAMALVSW